MWTCESCLLEDQIWEIVQHLIGVILIRTTGASLAQQILPIHILRRKVICSISLPFFINRNKCVVDFEATHVTLSIIHKGRFATNNGINLSKGLHGSQIGEIYLGRNQIDVPQHKVCVEIYHSFHANVG